MIRFAKVSTGVFSLAFKFYLCNAYRERRRDLGPMKSWQPGNEAGCHILPDEKSDGKMSKSDSQCCPAFVQAPKNYAHGHSTNAGLSFH